MSLLRRARIARVFALEPPHPDRLALAKVLLLFNDGAHARVWGLFPRLSPLVEYGVVLAADRRSVASAEILAVDADAKSAYDAVALHEKVCKAPAVARRRLRDHKIKLADLAAAAQIAQAPAAPGWGASPGPSAAWSLAQTADWAFDGAFGFDRLRAWPAECDAVDWAARLLSANAPSPLTPLARVTGAVPDHLVDRMRDARRTLRDAIAKRYAALLAVLRRGGLRVVNLDFTSQGALDAAVSDMLVEFDDALTVTTTGIAGGRLGPADQKVVRLYDLGAEFGAGRGLVVLEAHRLSLARLTELAARNHTTLLVGSAFGMACGRLEPGDCPFGFAEIANLLGAVPAAESVAQHYREMRASVDRGEPGMAEVECGPGAQITKRHALMRLAAGGVRRGEVIESRWGWTGAGAGAVSRFCAANGLRVVDTSDARCVCETPPRCAWEVFFGAAAGACAGQYTPLTTALRAGAAGFEVYVAGCD